MRTTKSTHVGLRDFKITYRNIDEYDDYAMKPWRQNENSET